MIHRFSTCLLKEDGTYLTQTVNGVKDIVVYDKKEMYDFDEIMDVVERSFFLERLQYGWEVKFLDADGQRKNLFIRSSHLHSCNWSTREGESVHEWIERIYERDDKQLELF